MKYYKNITDYVVIYSHGNSTDIGNQIDSYLDLSLNCKINVLAYDYCGYGISKGNTSDLNIIDDIISVYNFAINILQYC